MSRTYKTRLRKRAARLTGGTIVVLSALSASASTADACAVCFGDPNSQLTKAMAPGILFLPGCIGTVLNRLAGLFCYWGSEERP